MTEQTKSPYDMLKDAIKDNNIEAARAITQNDSSISSIPPNLLTDLLNDAMTAGRPEIAQMLYDKEAIPTPEYSAEGLYKAIIKRDITMFNLLVDHGAFEHMQTNWNPPPLVKELPFLIDAPVAETDMQFIIEMNKKIGLSRREYLDAAIGKNQPQHIETALNAVKEYYKAHLSPELKARLDDLADRTGLGFDYRETPFKAILQKPKQKPEDAGFKIRNSKGTTIIFYNTSGNTDNPDFIPPTQGVISDFSKVTQQLETIANVRFYDINALTDADKKYFEAENIKVPPKADVSLVINTKPNVMGAYGYGIIELSPAIVEDYGLTKDGFAVLLHESLHMMGFEHPGNKIKLPIDLSPDDTREVCGAKVPAQFDPYMTVESSGGGTFFKPYDVQALQYVYGPTLGGATHHKNYPLDFPNYMHVEHAYQRDIEGNVAFFNPKNATDAEKIEEVNLQEYKLRFKSGRVVNLYDVFDTSKPWNFRVDNDIKLVMPADVVLSSVTHTDNYVSFNNSRIVKLENQLKKGDYAAAKETIQTVGLSPSVAHIFLIDAIKTDNAEAADVILKSGTSIPPDLLTDALNNAMTAGRPEITQMLYDKGAIPTPHYSAQGLQKAITDRNTTMLNLLVAHGSVTHIDNAWKIPAKDLPFFLEALKGEDDKKFIVEMNKKTGISPLEYLDNAISKNHPDHIEVALQAVNELPKTPELKARLEALAALSEKEKPLAADQIRKFISSCEWSCADPAKPKESPVKPEATPLVVSSLPYGKGAIDSNYRRA